MTKNPPVRWCWACSTLRTSSDRPCSAFRLGWHWHCKKPVRCSYGMRRKGLAKQCTDTNHFTSHSTPYKPTQRQQDDSSPTSPEADLSPSRRRTVPTRLEMTHHSCQTRTRTQSATKPSGALPHPSSSRQMVSTTRIATVSVSVLHPALPLHAMPSTEEAGACSCERVGGGSMEVAWVL